MKIEVSDGEIADKYSILCLKLDRIQDGAKRAQVQQEKDLLHEYASVLIRKYPLYYDLLCHVNGMIWDKTDAVKSLSLPHDLGEFARLSLEIFSHNDQRFRLKRVFQCGSHVREQKSYADKVIHLNVGSQDILNGKIDELVYMVLEYDRVCIGAAGFTAIIMANILPPSFVSFSPPCPDGVDLADLVVDDAVALSIIRHHFSSARAHA